MIGQSPHFEAVLRSARVVAATDVTVLVVGETGTGKELLTEFLVRNSPRAEKRLVKINCAALPESLVESELFGHRKGSFTGADSTEIGRLRSADGGTVFLDEVDAMPLSVQAKLLRFFETGECQAVGETATNRVDVRIIAATNSQLRDKVDAGVFRKDLYYRLNVVPLEVPCLRDRTEDIEPLLTHYLGHFAKVHGLPPASFSAPAVSYLTVYDWPGNIRELRNLCERLAILRAGKVIEPEKLPPGIRNHRSEAKRFIILPESGINLESLEAELIRQAIRKTNGNRTRSARLLGISRDTLLYRMEKYGIR